MKNEFIKGYALYDDQIDGFVLGHGFYGNGLNLTVFETKDEAQMKVDAYYEGTRVRVRTIKCAGQL